MEQRVVALEKQLVANSVRNRHNREAPPVAADLPWDLALPPSISPDSLSQSLTPEKSVSSPNVALNLSCNLGAFPASSMTNTPIDDTGKGPSLKPDIISRGIISEAAGQELLDFYHEHLDKHIYNILEAASSLSEIRQRSSLLTASVCAVSAFVSASHQFESCLKAFTNEVAGQLFAKEHTFDEIRALCIGSFWLSDNSAALSSLGKGAIGSQSD